MLATFRGTLLAEANWAIKDPIALFQAGAPDGNLTVVLVSPALDGSATCLLPLLPNLRKDVRIIGLQPPIEIRNRTFGGPADGPPGTIESIAKFYVDLLAARERNNKLVIIGFSLSVIIGLEIAKQLSALGREPVLLVTLDEAPKNTPVDRRSNIEHEFYKARDFVRRLLNLWKRTSSTHAFTRILLKKIAPPASTEAELLRQGSVPLKLINLSRISEEYLEFIRGLYEAAVNYVPGTYTGRILAFVCPTNQRIKSKWRAVAGRMVKFQDADSHHIDLPADRFVAHRINLELQKYVAPPAAHPSWIRPLSQRQASESGGAVIESAEANIAVNAMAALQWALTMLKEHPVLGALGWIAAVVFPAILLDVALEQVVNK
jgi:thioesterase domain-containing protein